jgi:hypothetical protein
MIAVGDVLGALDLSDAAYKELLETIPTEVPKKVRSSQV